MNATPLDRLTGDRKWSGQSVLAGAKVRQTELMQ